MASFDCPHKDIQNERCFRLKKICVPGQKGCVLENSSFSVDPETRVRAKEQANRAGNNNEDQ
ncbi:MAG: hypothetical protein ACLFN5_03715 [bacterium]